MKQSNTPRDTEFRRIIGGYIEVSGLTREQISANLGISSQCFRNYMKVPDMFRRGDVRRLCDMLNVSKEERGKLI